MGSGLSAIFGGSMLCIAVVRIGRPAIYLDWVVSALLYIGLGIVLAGHSALVSTPVFGLFCFLFIASALLRTWTGATLEAGGGTAWLIAGGLTGLFCVAWMIFMRLGAIDVDPDFVLSVDLMVHGVSIAGFGLGRYGRPRCKQGTPSLLQRHQFLSAETRSHSPDDVVICCDSVAIQI